MIKQRLIVLVRRKNDSRHCLSIY